MTSFQQIKNLFNFIENTNHPLSLYPECNNYSNIIIAFLNGDFDTFNNYILYIKNKSYYPPMDFVVVDIIEHINNSTNNELDKYKLFCILFWLYLKKHKEINELSNKLTQMIIDN